jgi:hypothetical protein
MRSLADPVAFPAAGWLGGRRAEALAAPRAAAKSCPGGFMERTAAAMELKQQGDLPVCRLTKNDSCV